MKDTDKKQETIPDKDKQSNGHKRKKQTRRDWETASFAGLMFSLSEYKDRLEEQRAFKLNSKPREIDVRIIDKKYDEDDRMDNAIGYLFEKHNIIELKNPYEKLNIDVVWKGISYAAQYKSKGYDDTTKEKGVNVIPMKDVTLTFLRIVKPEELFDLMRAYGYGVEEKFPGVYYIAGMADIKMQVVVGSELEGDEFVSLRIQRKNASEEDIRVFTRMVEKLPDKYELELASVIADISMSENRKLIERLKKEDPNMRGVVFEIFKDEIEADKNEAVTTATTNTQEDIAKKMIEIGDPLDKIAKVTSVTMERLKELAKMLSGTPVRG